MTNEETLAVIVFAIIVMIKPILMALSLWKESIDYRAEKHLRELAHKMKEQSKMVNGESDYHPEAISQGRMARLTGHKLSTNPFHVVGTEYMSKSWDAGWYEVDQDDEAPKEEIY